MTIIGNIFWSSVHFFYCMGSFVFFISHLKNYKIGKLVGLSFFLCVAVQQFIFILLNGAYPLISFVLHIISLILIVSFLFLHNKKYSPFSFILPIFSYVLFNSAFFLSSTEKIYDTIELKIFIHILFFVLAYLLFSFSAVQSFIFTVLFWRLKFKKVNFLLPSSSLGKLEKGNFVCIITGLIFFTVAFLLALNNDNNSLQEKFLQQRILLPIFIWFSYCSIIMYRIKRGFGGIRTAIFSLAVFIIAVVVFFQEISFINK